MVRVFGCQGSGVRLGVAVRLPAAAGTLPPLLPPPPPTTPKGFDISAVDSHSGRLRDKSTEAGGTSLPPFVCRSGFACAVGASHSQRARGVGFACGWVACWLRVVRPLTHRPALHPFGGVGRARCLLWFDTGMGEGFAPPKGCKFPHPVFYHNLAFQGTTSMIA